MELPIWEANLFFSIFYLTIAHPTLPVFYFEYFILKVTQIHFYTSNILLFWIWANSLLHFKLCGLKKKKRAEYANAQRGDWKSSFL